MTGVQAQGQAKSMSIEATIVRADGRVVPLGIIMQTHRSPLMRLWQRITRRFRKPTMTVSNPYIADHVALLGQWQHETGGAIPFHDWQAARGSQ